jgi:hypothetical protein
MTDQAVTRRARWMYELGRARWASHILLLVLPLLLLAHLIGRPAPLVLGLGGSIAVAGFGLAMLHDRYARAVRTGVLAGVPAFAIPLVVRSLHLLPVQTAVDPCIPAAFASGVIAGWLVSRRAVDEEHQRAFWIVAVATTALTGSLGCSVAGGGGVVGMIAGVIAGSAPVVLRAGARS